MISHKEHFRTIFHPCATGGANHTSLTLNIHPGIGVEKNIADTFLAEDAIGRQVHILQVSFYDNSAINGDIRIELQLDRIGNRDDLINGNRLGDLDYLIMLISVILFTLIDGTPILDRIQGIQKFLIGGQCSNIRAALFFLCVESEGCLLQCFNGCNDHIIIAGFCCSLCGNNGCTVSIMGSLCYPKAVRINVRSIRRNGNKSEKFFCFLNILIQNASVIGDRGELNAGVHVSAIIEDRIYRHSDLLEVVRGQHGVQIDGAGRDHHMAILVHSDGRIIIRQLQLRIGSVDHCDTLLEENRSICKNDLSVTFTYNAVGSVCNRTTILNAAKNRNRTVNMEV